SGASQFESGHRLQFYAPGNDSHANIGHEAGGILTMNLVGGTNKRIQTNSPVLVRSAGDALTVAKTNSEPVFSVNTDRSAIRLYPLTQVPTDRAYAGEISMVNGTLYVCRIGGTPGQWVPLMVTQGTTAQRPTNPMQGQQYWDQTLGRMIWWTGSAWVAPVTE